MKPITIDDIAKVAGVSKSTVSRVLNGTAGVRHEKQRAVHDATERLGFRPNVVAQSLASGRSMTIGVLTQLIGSPFYDTIAQGVVGALNGTGYSPIFVNGQWKRREEVDAIRALMGRRVDGLILIGGNVSGEEITSLCGDLPTVVVARRLGTDGGEAAAEGHQQCIYMDNVDGGYQATRHLLEHGHQDIAIIQGLPHHTDAVDRFLGYQQALQESGVPLNPHLVLDGDFSAEAGVRGVEELYARGTSFTAIFAANDMTAFGARLALHRRGIRVPEDVSLVGFDDQMESAFSTPPLSTVRQSGNEMGQEASAAILAMIQGEQRQSTMFKAELVARETVQRI